MLVVGEEEALAVTKHRWENNIKTDLKEVTIIYGNVDCIHLAQYGGQWRAVVITVTILGVP